MSVPSLHTWVPLTPEGSVRWLKYSFGPGTANTLAVRQDDSTWLVISPSKGSPPSVFEELEKEGAVTALLAPNAYHHIGQVAWRRRFPQAVSYAPPGARTRPMKKSPDVPYRPTDELAPKLRPQVNIVLPDGQKSLDLLLRVMASGRMIWWLGDLFSNMTVADQVWPLRVVARFLGGGLGYRCNSKPELVYVRDRRAWMRSVREGMDAHPPSIVVPAHGDPVVDDTARRTQELLRAAV